MELYNKETTNATSQPLFNVGDVVELNKLGKKEMPDGVDNISEEYIDHLLSHGLPMPTHKDRGGVVVEVWHDMADGFAYTTNTCFYGTWERYLQLKEQDDNGGETQ